MHTNIKENPRKLHQLLPLYRVLAFAVPFCSHLPVWNIRIKHEKSNQKAIRAHSCTDIYVMICVWLHSTSLFFPYCVPHMSNYFFSLISPRTSLHKKRHKHLYSAHIANRSSCNRSCCCRAPIAPECPAGTSFCL
jgi:hypothetical protein